MATYKDQLLSRLVREGWEHVETVELAAWWAADCWRLRSTRQAYGLELFVTFLVDPLWDGAHTGARPPVWAVVATTTMPESRSPADVVALLSMNKGKFAVKLEGFVAAVLAYRNDRHQHGKPDEPSCQS